MSTFKILSRSDKEKIRIQLGDFDPSKSERCKNFNKFFNNPRHPVIKQIMKKISEVERIPLSREEKKSKKLLLKWINDNWERISQHFREFKIIYEDGKTFDNGDMKIYQ